MLVKEIISENVPPLKPEDSVEKALDIMDLNRIASLPVVSTENEFQGIISEDFLLTIPNENSAIKEYPSALEPVFINESEHLFELIKKFGDSKHTLIPVTNEKNIYLGVAQMNEAMDVIANMPVVSGPGSIMVLEMNANDYSLTEIARLVESNDAKILGSFITKIPGVDMIELTLKINQSDIAPIIQTFERYQYQITASYHKSLHYDNLQERYESLMKFLNI